MRGGEEGGREGGRGRRGRRERGEERGGVGGKGVEEEEDTVIEGIRDNVGRHDTFKYECN